MGEMLRPSAYVTFDQAKFPDPAAMVSELQQLGFRVTLWIHPFINQECLSFGPAAAAGWLVRDTPVASWAGEGWLPGMAWCWAGRLAGYLDFTNAEVAQWWTDRLQLLRAEVGLDSFKFDAGEAKWLPTSYVLSGNHCISPLCPGRMTMRWWSMH